MKLVSTLAAFVASAGMASAVNLFTPGDFIIAIDTIGGATSDYPGAEGPANAIDGDPNTKYLNFAEENSGFIVTPNSGASVVQSLSFTTANDAPERDPSGYSLYGTNSPVLSTDNSLGNAESWTLISTAGVTLPGARFSTSTFDITNSASFSSYRLTFDTVANAGAANSMQIADVQFHTGLGGAGTAILGAGDPIIAVDLDDTLPASSYPPGEAPSFAIDGTDAKYLNFGGNGTGFIVTPSVGATILEEFTITSGNDAPDRDPVSYELYGTNEAIASTDNSDGSGENWNLIQAGDLTPPAGRDTPYATESVANSTAYDSYRIVFTNVNGGALMQIAEFQADGQVVPEPSAGLLALLGVAPFVLRRRRK